MPRMVKPLSDKKASNAKPKEKAYTLADGNGLHLLIKTDGRKLWEIVYLPWKHFLLLLFHSVIIDRFNSFKSVYCCGVIPSNT